MDRLQGPTPEKEFFVTVAVAEHDGGFGGFHGGFHQGWGPSGSGYGYGPGWCYFHPFRCERSL